MNVIQIQISIRSVLVRAGAGSGAGLSFQGGRNLGRWAFPLGSLSQTTSPPAESAGLRHWRGLGGKLDRLPRPALSPLAFLLSENLRSPRTESSASCWRQSANGRGFKSPGFMTSPILQKFGLGRAPEVDDACVLCFHHDGLVIQPANIPVVDCREFCRSASHSFFFAPAWESGHRHASHPSLEGCRQDGFRADSRQGVERQRAIYRQQNC